MKLSTIPFALERFSIKVQILPRGLHILLPAILNSKLDWLNRVEEEIIENKLHYKTKVRCKITLKWQDPNVMDEDEAIIKPAHVIRQKIDYISSRCLRYSSL